MSSSSTQNTQIFICPPASALSSLWPRRPQLVLERPSPHRAHVSETRRPPRTAEERRIRKQQYRRLAATTNGGPPDQTDMVDDSPEYARSPSWEPTSPSLLASSPSCPAGAAHDIGENARSPSWTPTSPPLLAYSSTKSYPSASINDGPEDTRSPSWTLTSPPPVATLPTTNRIQFPPPEDARPPSWSPSSPPLLSTLYWRAPRIQAMTMLTSPYSPDPAYHNIAPPQNALPPSLSAFSRSDYSPASPPPQGANIDPRSGFDSQKQEEEEEEEEEEDEEDEEAAAEDGTRTGPSFTHTLRHRRGNRSRSGRRRGS